MAKGHMYSRDSKKSVVMQMDTPMAIDFAILFRSNGDNIHHSRAFPVTTSALAVIMILAYTSRLSESQPQPIGCEAPNIFQPWMA